MSEMNDDKLRAILKRAASQWGPRGHATSASDITRCVEEGARLRAYRTGGGDRVEHARSRAIVDLVAAAQQHVRRQAEQGVSYEHLCEREEALFISWESKILSPERAQARTVECYELVQGWRERIRRSEVVRKGLRLARPTESLCEKLGLRANDDLQEVMASFQAGGVDVAHDDCAFYVTFPDGIEAFWCVCEREGMAEGRSALDLAVTRSVFGDSESEEIPMRVRSELYLFLFLVAETMVQH